MTAAVPLSDVIFNIDRKAVDAQATTLAALDRGCSLTKAVYVAKDGTGNTDTHYALHFVVFRNVDFEGCLHFLKEKAQLPATGVIRVTGIGCDANRDLIESVLGLKVDFVQEFRAAYDGVHFLFSHAKDRESLFYPPSPVDEGEKGAQYNKELGAALEKMRLDASVNNGPDPDALIPCIFMLFGSGLGTVVLYPDGKTKLIGGSQIGGRTLMSMGKALANTDGYDELMDLAKEGDCSRTDTTMGELVKDDPNSAYGIFPPHWPVFSFGKLADRNQTLHEFHRADRAASVVTLFSQILTTFAGDVSSCVGINRVVVGGHGIKSEVMRKALEDTNRRRLGAFDIKFLSSGSTGALGAMLCPNASK